MPKAEINRRKSSPTRFCQLRGSRHLILRLTRSPRACAPLVRPYLSRPLSSCPQAGLRPPEAYLPPSYQQTPEPTSPPLSVLNMDGLRALVLAQRAVPAAEVALHLIKGWPFAVVAARARASPLSPAPPPSFPRSLSFGTGELGQSMESLLCNCGSGNSLVRNTAEITLRANPCVAQRRGPTRHVFNCTSSHVYTHEIIERATFHSLVRPMGGRVGALTLLSLCAFASAAKLSQREWELTELQQIIRWISCANMTVVPERSDALRACPRVPGSFAGVVRAIRL